jgi:hypothetical protein
MTDEEIRTALLARAENETWRALSGAAGVSQETLRQFALEPGRKLGARSRAAVLLWLQPVSLPPSVAEEIRKALGHARETVRLLEAVVASAGRRNEAEAIALREAAAQTIADGDVTKPAGAAARPRKSKAEYSHRA